MPAAMRSRDMEIPPGFFPDRSKLSAVARAACRGTVGELSRPIFTIGGWWTYRKTIQADLERIREARGTTQPVPPEFYVCWTINRTQEMRHLLRLGVLRDPDRLPRPPPLPAQPQAPQGRPPRRPACSDASAPPATGAEGFCKRPCGQKPQTSIWAILRGTSPATEMTRVLLMHRLHDRLFSLPVSRGAEMPKRNNQFIE